MKRLFLLGTLLTLGSLSLTAAQQTSATNAPKVIDIQKLKDNLYVLTSSTPGNAATFSGGNVAVFITDGGVTLVDDKLAGWGQAVLDKVKSVSNKPITRIINTHTHGDHTGNNNFFGASVEIVAQENTKANMAKMDAFKGDNAKYLPSKTYTDKTTIGSGKDRIDLYYFGAGHTNGDTFVVFPALRVLHTGDMFAWKDGPLCDRNNGGSCVAFPQTLSKVIATIKDVDTVIPGHSPMQTPKDLAEFQRFVADLSKHAQDSMKAGKSVDDAFASFSVDKYPGYKNERVKGSIQAVYDELKK
ncbi:MAG TPA: MBL fold metallo-hydrolase [Vicinamibacterales bacterium]|nr:MBL fold metallo-hydrolase [Vicinamibacterales bacterium]